MVLSTPSPFTAANPTRIRVAALDDDPVDLEQLGRLLRGLDDEVALTSCHDMPALLTSLSETQVDVVLLDYGLGQVTGLQALEHIRKVGWDGPVILLTGRGDEDVVVEAFRAGVSDYMSKDMLTLSALRRAMSNAIEKHQLRRELAQEQVGLARSVEELSRQNREIQSFYHSLSHELKTPLTSVREFVSLVADGVTGEIPSQAAELLRKALRNCDQLVVAMNDILDATRLDTGKLELKASPTDLIDLIDLVVADHAKAADAKAVELGRGPGRIPGPANVDGKRVFQIVSNLVSNAIKFTEPGGEIVVDAGVDPDRPSFWWIEVRDTGRGIPAEDLESVFERLFQSRHDDSAVIGGLGIGLYLCRQIARLHGGEITVESEPEVGSRFRFSFPADGPPALAITEDPESTHGTR